MERSGAHARPAERRAGVKLCPLFLAFGLVLVAVGSASAQVVIRQSAGKVILKCPQPPAPGTRGEVLQDVGGQQLPLAKIEVISVKGTTCTAKVIAIGQGMRINPGMKVRFQPRSLSGSGSQVRNQGAPQEKSERASCVQGRQAFQAGNFREAERLMQACGDRQASRVAAFLAEVKAHDWGAAAASWKKVRANSLTSSRMKVIDEILGNALAVPHGTSPAGVKSWGRLPDFLVGAALRVGEAPRAVHTETGLHFVRIPAGRFQMGCPVSEACASDIVPQHEVVLKSFWAQTTETTRKAWRMFASATGRPSGPAGNEDVPITGVDWNEAEAFCSWIGGRLPSEAEWEYLAGGGGLQPASTGSLNGLGTRKGDHWRGLAAVDDLKPSVLGFRGLLGNAMEWVGDVYHLTYLGAPTDGATWNDGGTPYRVLRGGSFADPAPHLNPQYRNFNLPQASFAIYGFRCVVEGP